VVVEAVAVAVAVVIVVLVRVVLCGSVERGYGVLSRVWGVWSRIG